METNIVSPFLINLSRAIEHSGLIPCFKNKDILIWDLAGKKGHVLSEEEVGFLSSFAYPTRKEQLISKYPRIYDKLLNRGMIAASKELYSYSNYLWAEVEIMCHCNFSCQYCPVSTNARTPEFMRSEIYEMVLDRLKEYGIKTIAFHHYNEPTLDPQLLKKMYAAEEYGFDMQLFTNASGLCRKLQDGIQRINRTVEILVNFPAIDPERYIQETGANIRIFETVKNNIRYLANSSLDFKLLINLTKNLDMSEIAKIKDHFSLDDKQVKLHETTNRAGNLENDLYAEPNYNSPPLNGCINAFYSVSITCSGKVSLCCMDFQQKYILGDLTTHPLHEITMSEEYLAIREKLFGGSTDYDSFLCCSCPRTKERESFSVGSGDNELLIDSIIRDNFVYIQGIMNDRRRSQ